MCSLIPLPTLKSGLPMRVDLISTLFFASLFLTNCTSQPKSEVVVSIKDQRMGLYEEGQLKKKYVISTSKFGVGDKPNSFCTPLGKHEVIAKIGHGLPTGAVLKSRHWNGEVLKPNAPGRDPIVSRILWLRGMESNNRNAMRRFIYIHGTPEENRLGTPASYGCIRMGMKDVVRVFDDVGIGAKVVITKDHLPSGKVTPTEVEPPTDKPLDPPPAVPVDKAQVAEAKPTTATPVTAPEVAIPIADEPEKKSSWSLFKRSKSKPQEPEVIAANPESKDKSESAKTPEKKTLSKPAENLKIGPATPEPLAKGKGKKDKVEKVSSSSTSLRSERKSHLAHS